MADNAAAPAAAAASDTKPPVSVNPDRVGEELADDARIWHVYDRVAREDDERRTKAWDNGLNNLALFAGLFSAVTTAFIIEAQQDMEPDYAQLTFLVLNATAFGEKPIHRPFVVPPSARTVNCLWVASLVLSLSAALIAIMGKDWIGMYTARPVCNLRQWAEMRTYRLRCVEQWYMSGVIAAAPVLLHVSLILFGAGLVLFISSDQLTHRLTLGLALAAGALYLVTTFSAVVFSASPFKSPATQMIRSSLSRVFSYMRGVIYRPKRNLVHSLLRDVNAMVVGGADNDVLFPECLAQDRKLHIRWRPAALLSSAGGAAITRFRNIYTLVRSARHNLQWSHTRARLHSIASADLPLGDWFFSSTWTDLPADRRPKLLAEALSRLTDASQAPDVFRAVVFALGDLDIGPQVGRHTSLGLRTRLRAEIRRTWQQVDFLTLSRCVLADRNIPGDPVLNYHQFVRRSDESGNFALPCEDGLAAVIAIDPDMILPHDVARYSPDLVTQPRMLQFLLPHIQKTERYLTDDLVLLSIRYRAYLWTSDPSKLNIFNLEAHLYRSLDADTREVYASNVAVKYGGTAGAVELLTFLCCHGVIDDVAKPAAVELIMELLGAEHRCLAYLFGSSELWRVAWPDKHWSSSSLWGLSGCLENSRRHPFQPSSARTQSDDREFDVALARASVMLLAPEHNAFGGEHKSISFLCGHLCEPPSPGILDDNGKLGVICLILKSAALLRIVGMPEYFGYADEPTVSGTAILAAIIRDLGRRLRQRATFRDGKQLFQGLVFTEVKGENSDSLTWDLGEWLRVKAPEILRQCPSATTAMQGVHNALVELHPLCESNSELRTHWDRIGYPGRAGDIFSDPFLDIGAFFDNAEAPRTRPGDIFDGPEWFDLATEFFDGAEEGVYHWSA